MGSLQVISSANFSTTSSDVGGPISVNATGSAIQQNNSNLGGDRLIYTNNLTDADFKNYYTSVIPALPREFTGVGEVSITGFYTVIGTNINITSSTILISFTGGLIGSLPSISFSGPISDGGTSISLQNLIGITNTSVPSLPLNLTIRISGAAINSERNLRANVSMQFTPAFVNLDSGIRFRPLAPGFIISNFSAGSLSGSSGILRTVVFNSRTITHQLF